MHKEYSSYLTFSMKLNSLSNFGRQLPKEHSPEINSKSVHHFSKKCCFFVFIALVVILFNGAERFEQAWQRDT